MQRKLSQFTDSQRLDWVDCNRSAVHDSDQLHHWVVAWVGAGECGNPHGPNQKFIAHGQSYRECIDQFLAGNIVRIDQ